MSEENKALVHRLIKEVEAKAIFIHRISGGKVKEEWSASDMLQVLRQLDADSE